MERKGDLTANFLWQLYSDIISRCNQLIDECAHLQSTVFGYLAQNSENVFGKNNDAHLEIERPWIPNIKEVRGDNYYSFSPQDRALRNLYVTIGALAQSLQAMTKNVTDSYERAILVKRPSSKSDGVFWFITLRGHLLNNVIPYALTHLQHAQEKLVQLLENMPGLLPGPTLMRRWSSGGYGEFLSEYSRQVNVQVQILLFNLCVGDNKNNEAFDTWRANKFLVHSWSHNPTSRTTLNTVKYDAPAERAGDAVPPKRLSLMTVWSSYFYLEQPALFPLLYHEFAHHYSDMQQVDLPELNRTDTVHAYARNLWFSRTKETAGLLASISPIDRVNISFWTEYVTEIWADIVSLSLCGDGFFAALILQIVGLQGEDKYFSDYDPDADTRMPLDELGSLSRRMLPIPYPASDPAYFWEARTILAARAYKKIHGAKNDPPTDFKWVEALDPFLEDWWGSGSDVMAEHLTSREHQTYWSYRRKLNEWVANVIWDALSDFVEMLSKDGIVDKVIGNIHLSEGIRELICSDVTKYLAEVLADNSSKPLTSPMSDSRHWRLEDICPRIRWWAGSKVIEKIGAGGSCISEEEFERWAKTYTNHLCCDGSVAFRLAHEWQASKAHVFSTAAEYLRLKSISQEKESSDSAASKEVWPSDLAKWENEFLENLANVLNSAMVRRGISLEDKERLHNEARELAKLSYQCAGQDWDEIGTFFERNLEPLLLKQLKVFIESKHGVGSFTFGVLKPAYFSACNGYGQASDAAGKYFSRLSVVRDKRLQSSGFPRSGGDVDFFPLIGEYSFALYQPGFSCLNKGIHRSNQPPSILKQRDVLRVSSKPRKRECALTFIRVSQISFKYRWQWVLLAEKLSGQSDIYLSSAWEDVIIVTYHRNMSDLVCNIDDFKLSMRSWMDIHSNIGIPAMPCVGQVVVHSSSFVVKDFCARWNGYGNYLISERTGRYDISIDWQTCSPHAVMGELCKIPAEEWGMIESINTSLYRPVNQAGTSARAATFISQIILRHLGRGRTSITAKP
ncbi:MAG: hypothetical protein AB3X44_09750 [Leptothrix sp. (in: b-proteobacteria)]